MPSVLANGVRLNAASLGPRVAESEAAPVVLLHGLLVGNLATWYFGPARALAARHPVLCFDLRGHGRSERPAAGYDVATMAADLAGVVDHFAEPDDRPVSLVGHSYGALVALEYARRRPDRVDRLVVVEAPVRGTERDELLAFLDRPAEEMAEALPPELQAAVKAGGRRARRLVESLVALATETTLLTDLAEQREIEDEALAGVHAPTLLVYGRDSGCRGSAERLRAALPDARLEWLDGGHYLPLDAPEALAALIAPFLGR